MSMFGESMFDLDINYHSGAPFYYAAVSSVNPTGYLLLVNAYITVGVFNLVSDKIFVEAGAGPLIAYSSYKIISASKVLNLVDVRMGLATHAGLAWVLGPLALRIEGRYNLEKTSYSGWMFSTQIGF